MPDAFGTAIRDFHRDEQEVPLVQRDGEKTLEHPIDEFYFGTVDPDSHRARRIETDDAGPLLDIGAGAGRDALHFQKRFETVAIEVSDALVETMTERGVEDARRGDMFTLTEDFEANRFRSVLVIGTQTALAGSMTGLTAFLEDLATITDTNGRAIVDGYDPTTEGIEGLLGYREDPTPGLAHRVFWFEYGDRIDPALHFRLFGPDRLREAAAETSWNVADTWREDGSFYYRAALEK